MPSDKELEAATHAVRTVARAYCMCITVREATEVTLAALQAAEAIRKEEDVSREIVTDSPSLPISSPVGLIVTPALPTLPQVTEAYTGHFGTSDTSTSNRTTSAHVINGAKG